ncbi:hypothetical protein [Bradyrhizobium sp. LB11.1]|uniref:hypothetical protein n=1 Tax=Bradyrhizobium sp. LB11.1 TaxID=3156326 RepID=UPI00339401F7
MRIRHTQLLAVAFLISMGLPAFAGSTAMREGNFSRSPSNYRGTPYSPPAGVGIGTTRPVYGSGSGVPTSSADFVYADPRIVPPPSAVEAITPTPYPTVGESIPCPCIIPAPTYSYVLPDGELVDPREDLPKDEELKEYWRRQFTPTTETYWPEGDAAD